MKLTNRELDLVKSIDHLQRQKIRGLVGLVIVLVVYWILRYVGVLRELDVPFDSLLMFYLAFHVVGAFSNIHREDRIVELLRRYVNDDSEAIVAMAERNGESAA